jgi:hypothetical protein
MVLQSDDDIRTVLTEIYRVHNESKVNDIDQIMEAYAGQESIMFGELWAK